MKMTDLLALAFTGLRRRKTRTFLTVLGVVIGTLCIVLMFAMGLSNYQQFQDSLFNDNSLKTITLNTSEMPGQPGASLTDQVVASLRQLEHVEKVSPVISFPVTVTAGKYQASLYVTAMEGETMDVALGEGGLPQGSLPDILLGSSNRQAFIDPTEPPVYKSFEEQEAYIPPINWLEEKMTLTLGYGDDQEAPASKSYKMRISGLTEDSAYSEQSYVTYMNISAAKKIIMENRKLADSLGLSLNGYNQILVRVDEIDAVEGLLEEISALGFTAFSPVENIREMQKEQTRQQSQLFAIGFITLFVSAIGIANTMYANILERKKEIGVMKVVGTPLHHIRFIFLLEAAGLGAVGGLMGILLSYVLAAFLGGGMGDTVFLGMYFSQGASISIPWWLSLGAMAIAILIGTVSGVYPAFKASKLSPMEAMRGE